MHSRFCISCRLNCTNHSAEKLANQLVTLTHQPQPDGSAILAWLTCRGEKGISSFIVISLFYELISYKCKLLSHNKLHR